MFTKFEMMIGALCIAFIGVAIYMVELRSSATSLESAIQQPAQLPSSGITVADDTRVDAPVVVAPQQNTTMKIDDVTIGTGPAVENGDTVAVHYVGTLQDGTEFDSSVKRGTPFEFTVGAGQVIQGWEEGVVGMQVGGKRVLVIPPAMAYGEAGFPPVIPPSATLVFTIELLAIN